MNEEQVIQAAVQMRAAHYSLLEIGMYFELLRDQLGYDTDMLGRAWLRFIDM